MKHAFNFGFTLIECSECGSKARAAGSRCPDCGHEGRKDEVNAILSRRRQGVRAVRNFAARAELAPSDPLPYYISRDAWPRRLTAAVDATLKSLALFVSAPLDGDLQRDVASAIVELRLIATAFNEIPARRPYMSEQAARARGTTHLLRMAELYLESFTAPTPGEAQSLGKDAQAEIDAATAAFSLGDAASEVGARLGSAPLKDFLAVALEVLATEHPGSLLDIDADMARSVGDWLGRPVAVGQGANYAIAQILARAYLDVQRFDSLLVDASRLVESRETLRAVADEPGALDLLRRSRNAIVESTSSFAEALKTATSDDARMRRIVKLYGELFEDGATPLFAWYLRISGVRAAPIATLMQQNSTELLRSIDANPALRGIFLGSNATIRHAASHGLSYELKGELLHFSLHSFTGSMTVEIVIDLLLALLESLLAAFWMLDNELAALGVEGHTPDISLLGISMLAIAKHVLEVLGGEVLTAVEKDNQWTFQLGARGKVAPFIFAASLAGTPPTGLKSITIEYSHLPAGTLVVPADASRSFRDFKNLDGLELMRKNLEFLARATLDGRSALSRRHLESTANVGALALLDKNALGAIALLRDCARLGRDLRATDLVEFVEAVLGEWRSSVPSRLETLKATMRKWSSLPPPMLPEVSHTTVVMSQDIGNGSIGVATE